MNTQNLDASCHAAQHTRKHHGTDKHLLRINSHIIRMSRIQANGTNLIAPAALLKHKNNHNHGDGRDENTYVNTAGFHKLIQPYRNRQGLSVSSTRTHRSADQIRCNIKGYRVHQNGGTYFIYIIIGTQNRRNKGPGSCYRHSAYKTGHIQSRLRKEGPVNANISSCDTAQENLALNTYVKSTCFRCNCKGNGCQQQRSKSCQGCAQTELSVKSTAEQRRICINGIFPDGYDKQRTDTHRNEYRNKNPSNTI